MRSQEWSETDHQWMKRALELSQRGWPAPNPRVGCVIVKQGALVGHGWHAAAGHPHAEAMALESAEGKTKGSDAYVTMEPCSHFGRTPPCAQALIQAGVKRVFYALADPNPTASGGAAVLTRAGVETHRGLAQGEAIEANKWWLYSRFIPRPVVILKAALTQDGCMARSDGSSKWITSPESRGRGHELRAEMGAVLVGCRTVMADDPLLTARVEGVVNQPRPIVLDPHGRLSGSESVLKREGVIWVKGQPVADSRVMACPESKGEFELPVLLARLKSLGIMGVLVEGGSRTLELFIQEDLWDEMNVFVGPDSFQFGISAPKVMRGVATGKELSFGDQVMTVDSGPDRWIKVTRRERILGTIEAGLQSITSS